MLQAAPSLSSSFFSITAGTKRVAIEQALILAAGRGVRMGHRGHSIPKGFIEVGGHTLCAIAHTAGAVRHS
jgi:CTP:molybdopterin cytidylyltransferase MocA